MKRTLIILGIVLAVAVVGAAGYFGFRSSSPETPTLPQAPDTVPVTICDVKQTVTAPGSVVNVHSGRVNMPVAGGLAEILVRPGQSVKAGQVLARLDGAGQAELDLQIAQTRKALLDAQEALDEAQKVRDRIGRPRANQAGIDRAQGDLAAAEAALADAQKNYDALAGLPEDDPARMDAVQALDAARAVRTDAVSNLNWLMGTYTQSDLEAAEVTLALAKAQVEADQVKLDALTGPVFRAPFDGIVTAVKAGVGETLPAGTAIVEMIDPVAVEIETTVTEEDYPYVAVGQPVELYFDALPDDALTGTVSRIIPLRVSGDRPLYTVYLLPDRIPEHLVSGMTADTAILIAQAKGVLCLPRALVRASSGDTAAVSVWNGVTTETRQVKVGLRGDVYVEILSGLEEGEKVVSR
jgi:RND family efflux transporter MFP subunit